MRPRHRVQRLCALVRLTQPCAVLNPAALCCCRIWAHLSGHATAEGICMQNGSPPCFVGRVTISLPHLPAASHSEMPRRNNKRAACTKP